jgi:hypothetical protein
MKTVLVFLIVACSLAAQTIDLPLSAPLPPNFRAVPHQSGALIINDGPPAQVGVSIMGFPLATAKTINGVRGPWWLQGESLLAAPWAAEPDDATRAAIQTLLEPSIDFAFLAKPRIAAVLANFGDGKPHDFGFTQLASTRQAWLGETLPADNFHYRFMNSIGAEGFCNGHYDLPFWAWVNWLQTGDDATYSAALRWSIGQVTSGFIWSGPAKGMYRTEKGIDHVGSFGNPIWEKNWCRSTVMAWHVTGMPVFRLAAEAHRSALLALPANYWNGEWGARIPARILDDMLVLQEGMGYTMAARAVPFVRHVVSHADPVLNIWTNKGNNGNAPASPWMSAECWLACWQWMSREPSLADLRPRLMAIGRSILDRGIKPTPNGPLCWYRFHPAFEPPIALGHLGFLLPVARVVDPSRAADIQTMLTSYAGSLLSQIPHAVPAVMDIRADYGPKGPANYKDMLEILHGARR